MTTMNNPPLPQDAHEFLSRHGLTEAERVTFAADASPRSYTRLVGQGVLLMDDRNPARFASYRQIAAHLNALGLSAPRVLQAELDPGLALVEDFGDTTYAQCLSAGASEEELYTLAIDALLHLHHHPRGAEIDRPSYDLAMHLNELSIFAEWYAPVLQPELDLRAFDARWRGLWTEALAPVTERHETLVLRDFHVDNLMLLEARAGVARCGLLDFQDAILGPSEYDVVSLVQDARRDLAPGLEDRLLGRYCDRAPNHLGGSDAIRQRYALLGAQRHARILGVFVRLCQRDGKPRYLPFLPRVLSQFKSALVAARLIEIEKFLNKTLPGWTEVPPVAAIHSPC